LHAPKAPSEDVLNGLFDLSPAEIKVAQGIVSGKTIDSVALDLKLSRETVRGQLKSVFAKTGTGRQAELVGLLAGARLPGE
jgi:DNA-binding CsgD family transcriptional regulator